MSYTLEKVVYIIKLPVHMNFVKTSTFDIKTYTNYLLNNLNFYQIMT